MSYNYLTQFDASPSNYTPGAQTEQVWGVPRQIKAIAIHHWGDPNTNPTFEGVIAHFQDPASQVSAHFVATGTGRRVACMVAMGDNAWATDNENPYSVAIECDPRCRDEDYDVVAELIADIRYALGDLPLVPHKQFFNTECPGNWDLGRLDTIARTKVADARWGNVHDVTAQPSAQTSATADEVTQAYKDILERSPDQDGLFHYTTNGMTIAQVRADLLASTEYSSLQNDKAKAVAAALLAAKNVSVPPPQPPTTPPQAASSPTSPAPTQSIPTSPSEQTNTPSDAGHLTTGSSLLQPQRPVISTPETPSLATSSTTSNTSNTMANPFPPSHVSMTIWEDIPVIGGIILSLQGKKTYLVGLGMFIISVWQFFSGHVSLSEFVTTTSGLYGSVGLGLMALRAAITKIIAVLEETKL